jgi:hypothetical protein
MPLRQYIPSFLKIPFLADFKKLVQISFRKRRYKNFLVFRADSFCHHVISQYFWGNYDFMFSKQNILWELTSN